MQPINSNSGYQPLTYPQQQVQQPVQQMQQFVPQVPSYNAVKIDIHNPAVNAPSQYGQMYPADASAAQTAMAAPQLAANPVPMCPVPQQQMAYPAAYPVTSPIPAQPAAPQPNPVQPVAPVVNAAPASSPSNADQTPPAPVADTATATAVQPDVAAPAVAVEKPVETVANSVAPIVSMLGGSSYEEQYKAMDEIVKEVQETPDSASKYVDNDVYQKLIDIVEKNTENIPGPTQNQLGLRAKIITNKNAVENGKKPPFVISDEDMALANEISDFEKAETNKMCALITMANLANLFNSVVEKQKGSVAPMSDIPCAAVMVDAIKNNSNPNVREKAIVALSMIQRPEYKNELETIFKIAQNDENDSVCKTASEALKQLSSVN